MHGVASWRWFRNANKQLHHFFFASQVQRSRQLTNIYRSCVHTHIHSLSVCGRGIHIWHGRRGRRMIGIFVSGKINCKQIWCLIGVTLVANWKRDRERERDGMPLNMAQFLNDIGKLIVKSAMAMPCMEPSIGGYVCGLDDLWPQPDRI